MTNRPVVGFDLDDVLFNLMDPLCQWHNLTHGTSHGRHDYSTFDLHEVWQCEGVEARNRVWNFYQSEQYKQSFPVEGAIDALQEIKRDFSCVIVTARPESMEEETRAWLDVHFPGIFDEVCFANHFHGTGIKRSKSSVCLELGVSVFIEDAIHNAHDIAGAGIPVLLFDTPWNREEVPPSIIRVSSWKEIIAQIRKITEGNNFLTKEKKYI
jgi:uncharacterized HAD superfamily protein